MTEISTKKRDIFKCILGHIVAHDIVQIISLVLACLPATSRCDSMSLFRGKENQKWAKVLDNNQDLIAGLQTIGWSESGVPVGVLMTPARMIGGLSDSTWSGSLTVHHSRVFGSLS